jgi:hypothetical protein
VTGNCDDPGSVCIVCPFVIVLSPSSLGIFR